MALANILIPAYKAITFQVYFHTFYAYGKKKVEPDGTVPGNQNINKYPNLEITKNQKSYHIFVDKYIITLTNNFCGTLSRY